MLTNKIEIEQLQSRLNIREKDTTDPRGHYFRDATAIMHSTPFRRLKHKTQVFFAPTNDHICTRLEHVLHVSSIAVTICKALKLDTDMAWAIGLGHDLGHTPFGHLGEEVLCKLTKREFCHELHSLRVVDNLAKLNLTYAVRDGIVTHCGEKFEQVIYPTHKVKNLSTYTDRNNYSSTYEGSIVRMADKIAYLGRDYEDAVTLGILNKDEMPLPLTHILGGEDNSSIINAFTLDVIDQANTHGKIGFSDKIYEALNIFKKYNYKNIYESELLEKQKQKFEKLLEIVYQQLFEGADICKDDIEKYTKSESILVQKFGNHIEKFSELYNISNKESRIEALIDYIAGMTDDYVISSVKKILFPLRKINRI